MGQQIIRQPNGQYAVFSTITDTVVLWDATEAEIVQWFIDQAAQDTDRRVRRLLEHVAAGEPRKAYYQFAMTWEEALEMDKEHGGEVRRASQGHSTPTP